MLQIFQTFESQKMLRAAILLLNFVLFSMKFSSTLYSLEINNGTQKPF